MSANNAAGASNSAMQPWSSTKTWVDNHQDCHLIKLRSPNDLLNCAVHAHVDSRGCFVNHVCIQSSDVTQKKDGHTFIENKHLRLSQHMVCQQLLTVKHQIALTFFSNALAKQSNCPCPANNVSPSCTSALRPLGRLSTYDFKWA